jgi:hypothetical protein
MPTHGRRTADSAAFILHALRVAANARIGSKPTGFPGFG